MSEWKSLKLSDIAYLSSDKIEMQDVGLNNYISTDNMLPDKSGVEPAIKLPSAKRVSHFEKGDILFSNIRPYFKKVWLAEFEGGASADVLVWKPLDKELVTKEYLYYLLSSDEFIEYSVRTSKGVKMPRGDKEAMLSYELILPPIEVQRNIALLGRRLDHKITNNTVMNATLEKIAQRIFKSWFIDFDPVKANAESVQFDGLSPEIQALFPNEFEESELGMIPKGWEVIKFKELIKKYIDNRGKTPPLVEKGIPLIEVKHLDPSGCYPILKTQKQVSQETYDTWFRAHVEKDDILMSTVGTIGRTSLVNDTNLTIAQNVIGLRFNEKLTPLYMFRTIKGDYFQKQIEARLVITVQASIKRKDMDTIPVLVPPKNLLEKFEEIMIPLQDSQFLKNQQNITLTDIRDKLLPRLISGKITIQKAEELLEEAS